MQTGDKVKLEADIFIVEKSNGDGFALLHREKDGGDLRVIRKAEYKKDGDLWLEKTDAEKVKEAGRC